MEKVAVSVKVPALDNTYEFLIPSNMIVRNVLNLMVRILSSEYGISDNSDGLMLFDMSDHTALPSEHCFEELGICDGAKLLMI